MLTKNHTIMIVDDDQGTRESLEEILEDDYDVVCVKDGRAAVKKIKEDGMINELICSGSDMSIRSFANLLEKRILRI